MCLNIFTFAVHLHCNQDRWYNNPRLLVKVWSLKSVGFILWQPWTSDFTAVHFIVVDIFFQVEQKEIKISCFKRSFCHRRRQFVQINSVSCSVLMKRSTESQINCSVVSVINLMIKLTGQDEAKEVCCGLVVWHGWVEVFNMLIFEMWCGCGAGKKGGLTKRERGLAGVMWTQLDREMF